MGGTGDSAKTATLRAASRGGVHQVMRASSLQPSTTNNRDEVRQPPEKAEHLQHVNVAKIAAVGPDFGAVGGSSQLRAIVGALLTYGLIVSVLMVVICAATWAIGSANGSWQTAGKGKVGLFVALGGATLTGGALAWANWLLDVGATL